MWCVHGCRDLQTRRLWQLLNLPDGELKGGVRVFSQRVRRAQLRVQAEAHAAERSAVADDITQLEKEALQAVAVSSDSTHPVTAGLGPRISALRARVNACAEYRTWQPQQLARLDALDGRCGCTSRPCGLACTVVSLM